MLTPEQLEKIALKLQSLNRIDLGHQFEDFACVAILLKNVDGQSSIGFIKRAENPADNWSGQLAFPGGRKGPEDQDAAAAVMREVKE